jgi:hypothetical protein
MSVTEPVTQPKANPYVQIVIGVLVFFAGSFAALLAAGELGVPGVFIAALIEAIVIAGLYRWCAA